MASKGRKSRSKSKKRKKKSQKAADAEASESSAPAEPTAAAEEPAEAEPKKATEKTPSKKAPPKKKAAKKRATAAKKEPAKKKAPGKKAQKKTAEGKKTGKKVDENIEPDEEATAASTEPEPAEPTTEPIEAETPPKKKRKKKKKKAQSKRAEEEPAGTATEAASEEPSSSEEAKPPPPDADDSEVHLLDGEPAPAESDVEVFPLDEETDVGPDENDIDVFVLDGSDAEATADEEADVFSLDEEPPVDVDEVADLDAALESLDEESVDELIAATAALGETEEEGSEAEPDHAKAGEEEPAVIDLDAIVDDTSEEEAEEEGVGPTSTPEARARLLSEALAHAEMQEARYRVPMEISTAARWKGSLSGLVLLFAAFFALFPPAVVTPEPPPELVDSDYVYGLRVGLLLQAQQVEAFRARAERLPDTLDEVATQVPGVRYVKSGNRLYQLIAYTPTGDAVIYDSSAPAREFESITPAWATGDGS